MLMGTLPGIRQELILNFLNSRSARAVAAQNPLYTQIRMGIPAPDFDPDQDTAGDFIESLP